MRFRRRVFLIVLILAVLFSIKERNSSITFIRTAIPRLFKIPLQLTYSFSHSLKNVFSQHHRPEENLKLREENIRLLDQIQRTEELIEENERLKALLVFKDSIEFKTIAARVIARNWQLTSRTLLINKGSGDGINRDMPVVTAEGLIGRIDQVGKGVARVLVLSDPSSRVAVVDQRSRADGLLIGQGRKKLKMSLVPIEADIQPGDAIISSGFSLIFPRGLRVGTVIEVGPEEGHLTQYAIVEPSASFNIEEVVCLEYQPDVSF